MTSATTTERLIAPHGGTLVDRTGEAPADLDSLEVVAITSRELSDLDMIASGALSPLEGFMGREDYERVVDEMHLMNGVPWALPVCLAVDSAPVGDRVALTDEGGTPVAVLEVEETYEYDMEREARRAHVIDRTFTDAKGERWVADYKTGTHTGTDPEGFLDRERGRYAEQLDRYAMALGGARRGLYFPLLKGWREWPPR